jgi:hypothetical protein
MVKTVRIEDLTGDLADDDLSSFPIGVRNPRQADGPSFSLLEQQ